MESTWYGRICHWLAHRLPRAVCFHAHCRWMVKTQDGDWTDAGGEGE